MRRLLPILGLVVVAGFALPVQATPGNPHQGGTGTIACNDGTVTWSPTTLWPPNHKMQTIDISYADTDNDGDSTSITVGAITHDQAASDGTDELNGSGPPGEGLDWAGTGNTGSGSDPDTPATTTAQVRAERTGRDKTGRTYTIEVTCSDSGGSDLSEMFGETQTVDLTVTVPHDQGQRGNARSLLIA